MGISTTGTKVKIDDLPIVILAAQAIQLQAKGYEVKIVTTNVGHLAQFVHASHCQDLPIDRD